MRELLFIALGLAAGTLSGLFGIGGGTILIPGLVFLAGLSQHEAQGTILAAMIPPIGLLAAIKYYQSGNVKVGVAALIALGFLVGGYAGAWLVQYIPDPALKKLFGIFLLVISLRMIFFK